MGSYRFELAPSGRAGCSNKECKDAKVKIVKGELRVGSWIEGGQFQGFSWRHWGCTTPKIIQHIRESLEESRLSEDPNYDLLDGYDELPEDCQAQIRKALEQGHVDDADWKGDVEMNRPGKSGFRVRGKKKTDDEDKDEDEDKAPAAKKQHGRASSADKEDKKEKLTKETKKLARGKKAVDDAGVDSVPQPPKKRGRPSKGAATDEAADADSQPPKKRGRPSKTPAPDEDGPKTAKKRAKADASKGVEQDVTEEQPKHDRGKVAKTQQAQAKKKSGATEDKPKRGRKKAETK